MDGRRPGVCCVLVLLVVRAAVSQDDLTSIALDSMTWTAQTLTVCSAELSADATLFHLVANAGPQTVIYGDRDTADATCAVFNTTDYPEPLAAETTYELTTFYNATKELQTGIVTFAFPLSQGTTVSCGTSIFGCFVVDSGVSLPDESCFSGSAPDVCYVNTDSSGALCVPGLDENTAGFEVCVPSVPTGGITNGLITTVSLAYADDTNGNRFTITPGVDPQTNSLELLIQESTGTPPPSVTTCDGNACTFVGNPSQKLYDLCGVSINGDGSVASVGTNQFQDLQLTVDAVGTTVDFRFANKNEADNYVYNVYGDDIVSNPAIDPSFTLDCHNISPDSFCNGFFDDNPLPTYISVSSLAKNNIVVAPVPTTAGSAPVLPPKVNQNALDLTDQKTEGIVPSSA